MRQKKVREKIFAWSPLLFEFLPRGTKRISSFKRVTVFFGPPCKFQAKKLTNKNSYAKFCLETLTSTLFQPHVAPFSKPSVVVPFSKPSFINKAPQAAPQFPPTPSTIIKPPRFYSNQIFIVPRAKPTGSDAVSGVVQATDSGDCICEREDAIIICQKWIFLLNLSVFVNFIVWR